MGQQRVAGRGANDLLFVAFSAEVLKFEPSGLASNDLELIWGLVVDEGVEGFLDLVLVLLVLLDELLVVEFEFVTSDFCDSVYLDEFDSVSVDLVFQKTLFSKGDV